MLLWTEKPNATECQKVGVDSGKFFCGRKGKFGLNLLGVCDSMRRFTYISVQHPASASDYLAFVMSSLYVQFTEGEGLLKGFCLYGDNAYVNDTYMAVPFPNTSNGPRDSYNYYHSQVRINIECSFGVLTNRWQILKSPLSSHLSIHRINALVLCLCKLHNFCIDNGNASPLKHYVHDRLTLMDFMQSRVQDDDPDDNSGDVIPIRLLGGGEHFEDVAGGRREATRTVQRHINGANTDCPRSIMLDHVISRDIHCPRPFDT